MPALGMTQDTGEILSWNFALGAQVQADDILFEVETDKTSVEVEAGTAGIVVEVRAAVGEAVPVGSVIAVIDSDESVVPMLNNTAAVPETAVIASGSSVTESTIATGAPSSSLESSAGLKADKPSTPAVAKQFGPAGSTAAVLAAKQSRATPAAGATLRKGQGLSAVLSTAHILASPKAKLAARDKGVSLEQMVAAGIDQPFQYVDVENYVPDTANSESKQSLLQARVEHTAYKDFLEWADKQTNTDPTSGSVWSLFASSAWRYSCAIDPMADVYVELEQWSNRDADLFSINADRVGLLEIVSYEHNGIVDMVVRDMTGTPLTHYQSPDEAVCPSLTVFDDGIDHLSLSLRFDESSLSLDSAVLLLNRLCQLVEQPLRHLL